MSKPLLSVTQAQITGGVTVGNNVETVVLNSPVVTIPDGASAVIIIGLMTCLPLGTSTSQLALFCRRGTGLLGVQVGKESYVQETSGGGTLGGSAQTVTGMWIDQIPGLGAKQWTINGFAVSAATGSPVYQASILVLVV